VICFWGKNRSRITNPPLGLIDRPLTKQHDDITLIVAKRSGD
jgi:hypothetical protein